MNNSDKLNNERNTPLAHEIQPLYTAYSQQAPLDLPPAVINFYEGLIFDMDGTLLETLTRHRRAWQEAGRHFGYELDTSIMDKMAGSPSLKIAAIMLENAGGPAELLPELTAYKVNLAKNYVVDQASYLPAFKVVTDYYQTKAVALGTGSMPEFLDIFRAKFSLDKYFGQAYVTAQDVAHHKPAPDTFLACANRISCEPSSCLVFEDGKFGLQAAHAADMDAYFVLTKSFFLNPAHLQPDHPLYSKKMQLKQLLEELGFKVETHIA